MTYCTKKKHILLVSDDKYIIGLLTGYCAANHFMLDDISCSRLFQDKNIDSKFKLILIDHRQMTDVLIEASLDLLQGLPYQKQFVVGVIHNKEHVTSLITRSWIDFFIKEPITDQLGDYLNNILTESHHGRRNSLRRNCTDRRIISEYLQDVSNSDALIEFDSDNYDLGPFKIDRSCHSVFYNGKDLELTNKEFKLFSLLADSFERVCTTDKIITHLWPQTHRATKSDLYQYMHLLRKKVEHDPDNPHWILTIKGVGYKLQVANKARLVN